MYCNSVLVGLPASLILRVHCAVSRCKTWQLDLFTELNDPNNTSQTLRSAFNGQWLRVLFLLSSNAHNFNRMKTPGMVSG